MTDPPGRGVFFGVLVATAAIIVVFAAARYDNGVGADPAQIVDASSPGPLELPPAPAPRHDSEPAKQTVAERATSLWPGKGFRLAAVRRGVRVSVHERPGGAVVERVGSKSEFGSARVFGVKARRGGWLRVSTDSSPDNSDLWIRADRRKLRFETTSVSLHSNLSARTVELRRGGTVVRRFPVTVGAPGSSTPTGRFAVTDLIVGGLNPAYGCCALALTAHQPDLPQGWIGGDRVAIHGTTGPVGHAASNGCLRADNDDVRALIETVPLGAPVFISG